MKPTIITIIFAVVLIGGAILLSGDDSTGGTGGNNVSVVNGVQIIDVSAKGGYSPRSTTAKAGIPTVLKVKTSGTFDCSSAFRIPSLDIAKNLPPSGTTEIDLGTPKAGILQGNCGMGMYPFEINFQS